MSKLIGTNPNQVPSNADLGTAAFMDKKEFLLSKGSEMSAIDAVITKTAVDVFIYDTTKDSDGGAWRKRTQHTSWYNEKLNTTTRGSRKEFPAVAVFVAEAARVTIYDGDDINMPMWMQWNTTGALGWASGTSSVWITLTVLNGIFVWGSDNRGLGFANFVKDKIEIIHGAQRYVLKDQSIGRRETNVGTITSSSDAQGGYSFPAQNDEIYDVAATVLPNAPIDPESGLPRPTLAYAGPGGLNIIRDNGAVVLITAGSGSSYNGVSWVDFTKNHNLIFEQDNSSNPRAVFCIPVPTANRTTQTSDGNITDKVIMKWYANGSHKPYPLFNGGGVNEAIRLLGDNQALKSQTGDLTILEPNLSDPEQGKVAYIESDYNTGWMVGDTKVSALTDTNATDISNYNLNPYTQATGSYGTITLDPKKTYKITITGYGDIDGQWPGYGGAIDTVHVYTGSATSPGVIQANLNIQNGGSSGSPISTTVYVTNFSSWNFNTWSTGTVTAYTVVECDYNRSMYYKPLNVYGTVIKTPVATGADLVGYSGWSASNYLAQPYNADLNFGTGDFSYMGWVKWVSGTGYLFDRADTSGNRRISVYPNSNGAVTFYTENGNQTSAASILSANVWTHLTVVRRSGVIYGYHNGVQIITGFADTGSKTSADGSALLKAGVRFNNADALNGSIALLRASATVPTDEQIAKIYNDEKHLFQENAKVTLYGTSDAVTALAYDDDTELLHVGTSAGRSDFQGLRRINNTTRAIATAISAADGFIVEE